MIVCDVLCSYCGRSIGLDSNFSAGFLDPTDVGAVVFDDDYYEEYAIHPECEAGSRQLLAEYTGDA